MARHKVRSGVRSTMLFLRRQIAAGRKVIHEAVVRLGQLKRADRRIRRLEQELRRAKAASRRKTKTSKPVKQIAAGKGLRSRGPNVREVALQVLTGAGKPMNISQIATAVIKRKGGKAGANFTMNLGAALNRDKRFKRVSRGVYGLRSRK